MNDSINDFLNRNVLKNIVPLKMLGAYGESMTCHFVEQGRSVGGIVAFANCGLDL